MKLRPAALGLAGCASIALTLACSACGKRDDGPQLAPSASALAVSKAAPSAPAGSVWHFAIDPQARTHVEMPGLKENIKGDTSAGAGTLDVVPADLAQSRGLIKIDLSTFATHTFGNDDDATQTKHARTWLEVVVDGQTNDSMRWADFAVRSIDGLSASDVTKVPAAHEGDTDVRRVTMTVHGDLLVHGHKVQKDDAVEVAFRYAPGSPADAKPVRIEMKSKQPMRVVLKEHDVSPRDTQGKIAAWTTNLIAKVAETADVTVDLAATPAP
jgi:hypothetical protein